MNCIPRAFPPPLRPILLGCSPRHRPLLLLATLVGLLLWFSVYLLDLSTAGQAEHVAQAGTRRQPSEGGWGPHDRWPGGQSAHISSRRGRAARPPRQPAARRPS